MPSDELPDLDWRAVYSRVVPSGLEQLSFPPTTIHRDWIAWLVFVTLI
jgi:hypothetical protein